MVTLGTKVFKCVNLPALVVVHRNHRVATVTYINNLSYFKTICLFFDFKIWKKTCRLPVRNSEHLKICHYMCVFRTEISQFRFWRPVTGSAPTEHISYSVYGVFDISPIHHIYNTEFVSLWTVYKLDSHYDVWADFYQRLGVRWLPSGSADESSPSLVNVGERCWTSYPLEILNMLKKADVWK